jgi:hypothetical protein
MSTKKVVIDTDRKKGQFFKVSESSGRFYVYDVDVGFITSDLTKIREVHSLEDAIQIIKASVSGMVQNIKISDW